MTRIDGKTYQVNKVDLIRMVREISKEYASKGELGLKDAKDAVDEWLLREADPQFHEAIAVIKKAQSEGAVNARKVAYLLGISSWDLTT